MMGKSEIQSLLNNKDYNFIKPHKKMLKVNSVKKKRKKNCAKRKACGV